MSNPTLSDIHNLLPSLKEHLHIDLGIQSTPLENLTRLSNELDINLFVKRDDCLPFALGGNKVRQLEYYLGPAKDMGADTVLITGAVQSNFVRLCAAACRKIGLHPIVQLEKRVPKEDSIYNSSGNVLLNHLLGADVIYFDEGEDEAAADANLDRIADDLSSQGKSPYVIHLGIDHPPIGALGYARAAVETFLQFKKQGSIPDHVVIPSGSGLTHAGFLCGARAIGWNIKVHGICVRRNAALQEKRIFQRAQEVDGLLKNCENVKQSDINIYDAVLAPGYGQLNEQVNHAIKLASHSESLLLDPVYSGRTFAGLIDLITSGIIKKDDSVCFIHTGGLAALFAYQNDLNAVF